MPQITLLLFIILVLSIFALLIHKGEILTPSFAMCAGFFISVIAAGMNLKAWSLNLHWNTIFVISSGLFSFILMDFFVSILASYYEHRVLRKTWRGIIAEHQGKISIRFIDCNRITITLLMLFAIYIALLYVRSVFSIVRNSGLNVSGWTDTMRIFRHLVSYYEGNQEVPALIEQCHQVIVFMGFVCIYLIVYQYFFFNRFNLWLSVLFLLSLGSSFLDGGRVMFVRYVMMFLICYDLFMYWSTGAGIKFKISAIVKLIIAAFLIFYVFSLLRAVVGRGDTRDPVSYVSFYLGGSVHNLDKYLQEYHTRPELWGKETFRNFYHGLYRITGIEKYNYVEHKEFIIKNGIDLGNVYTVFRSYLHDFGYVGMYVLTMLSSLICNVLYYWLRFSVWRTGRVGYRMSATLYLYLYSSVFVSFFASFFFAYATISMIWLKIMLSAWLWELLLTRIKFGATRKERFYESEFVRYRPGL